MPTGLSMPHDTSNGRLVLTDGEVQLAKIIMIAAGPRPNENPWNRAGVNIRVFGANDSATRASIRLGIGDHFKLLESMKRARLVSVTFSEQDDGGTLAVTVVYRDLSTSATKTATIAIGG